MPAGEGDNLLRMKGVGPKLNQQLIDLGVTRYAQIANWTDADIAAIDGKLGNFKGRPVRDQWVDQAKYLAAGDLAGFEAKYGKL
jgi:predicted flap endonuclease-1-like 5' DNA nuclease